MATGIKLQACLGGLSAPLAALAVLEEPDRIWQQEESRVTFLCPPGRTVQVLMGTPDAGSWAEYAPGVCLIRDLRAL